MPRTVTATPQDLADIVRDTIVATFDVIILALRDAPEDLTAREVGERFLESRADLEAQLIHNCEQAAAAQAARP